MTKSQQVVLHLAALFKHEIRTKNAAHTQIQKEEVKEPFKSLVSYTAHADHSPRVDIATLSHASHATEEQMQKQDATAPSGLQHPAALKAAVERTGRRTQGCGQGKECISILGQDRQAVLRLAYSRVQEQAQKRQRDRNRAWDPTLDKHHSFVKYLPPSCQTQELSVTIVARASRRSGIPRSSAIGIRTPWSCESSTIATAVLLTSSLASLMVSRCFTRSTICCMEGGKANRDANL